MPHCFIKSPDGKYHVFSSIVDDFVTVDCTAAEAVSSELANPYNCDYPGGKPALKRDLLQEIANIEKTGRAWEWAHTWDEVIPLIMSIHGADRESLKMLIDCGSLSKEAFTAFRHRVQADESGDSPALPAFIEPEKLPAPTGNKSPARFRR